MERAEEIAMFRTALRIADLHPDPITLPDDHQVIVGSMRFHYLDWGGTGTPILFLHGGGLNALPAPIARRHITPASVRRLTPVPPENHIRDDVLVAVS
ncbi:alpha/beta fold hydrolase [Candidatus Binatus sp.]|uniref:alpha/beta fold hydrolase n=1 Tax=Candidatus Binatus sp. TaxID=2811406 RepID=UPI003BAFC2DE